MPEIHVLAAWLAFVLVVPAVWGVTFTLRIQYRLRWVFVFLISLAVWGVSRMFFWDILPRLVHLDQWSSFSATYHGQAVNTALNLSMAAISAYAIVKERALVQARKTKRGK